MQYIFFSKVQRYGKYETIQNNGAIFIPHTHPPVQKGVKSQAPHPVLSLNLSRSKNAFTKLKRLACLA